ncbi:MAG: hypothetical protein ABSB15_10105 [Bryobacteraceae bacterium]|jgi:hypothetical protein
MATEAQIAANRINASEDVTARPYPHDAQSARSANGQGPRTIEGKARTSQNALSSGLFSKRDIVPPEETADYTELRDTLWAELHPATLMEKTQTAEIVSAT